MAVVRFIALCVATALAVSACLAAPDRGATEAQAQELLAQWSAAVSAAGGDQGFVVVGDLTRQVGDWEEAVGGNNKRALYAGLFELAAPLPAAPAEGRVAFADGTSKTVSVLPAQDVIDRIRREATASCADCAPLRITAAKLADDPVSTSRGTATAPTWEFSLAGTAVTIERVAIAQGAVVVSDWAAPPNGIMVDRATVSGDGRGVTVFFVGAPNPGDQSCGAGYTARAVESELAVVVLVTEHSHMSLGACAAVGAERSATATLASPLAARPVLDVVRGAAVPTEVP